MNYTEGLKQFPSKAAYARHLGIPVETLKNRIRAQQLAPLHHRADGQEAGLILPRFPNKHPSAPEIIDRLASDMRRKTARVNAERWFPVHLLDNKPIGIMWFGDPHLGVLCDWDQLRRDIAICVSTPGLYGANIGDVADNWTGSLMRIAAEQDISRGTERTLARYFLTEAGITWLVWLFGNHDEWNDGSDIMRMMDIHNKVPMFDWIARFELCFPNRKRVKVRCAHDMPGHSMWNATHGPSRAPRMLGDGADLYVAGHKHTWGLQQFEMPEAEKCPVAVRTRGYKRHDPHARRLGYPEDQHACSVLTIIDPTAGPAGRVLAFPDVEQGAKVLRALRGDTIATSPKRGDKPRKSSTRRAKPRRRR